MMAKDFGAEFALFLKPILFYMKTHSFFAAIFLVPMALFSQGETRREPVRTAQPVQAQPAPAPQRLAGAVIAQPAPAPQPAQTIPAQSAQPASESRPVTSGNRPAVRSVQKLSNQNVQRVKLEDNPRQNLKER